MKLENNLKNGFDTLENLQKNTLLEKLLVILSVNLLLVFI